MGLRPKRRPSRSPLECLRPESSPPENLVTKKRKVHPAADRSRAALGARRRVSLSLKRQKKMTKRKHSRLLLSLRLGLSLPFNPRSEMTCKRDLYLRKVTADPGHLKILMADCKA